MEKEDLAKRVDQVSHFQNSSFRFFSSVEFNYQIYPILILQLQERYKNFDVEDYDRMRAAMEQMQVDFYVHLFSGNI